MSPHSVREPGPSAAAENQRTRPAGRAAIEPMLPALVRGVVFFCAFATPFVAALLIR
jgi:hypothetical protein